MKLTEDIALESFRSGLNCARSLLRKVVCEKCITDTVKIVEELIGN